MPEKIEDLLKVGIITSTHGLKGEVKVFPTTDDPGRFDLLDEVLMDNGKEKIVLQIERVKYFKNMVILKFKNYDHINDIEIFRQKELYITRDQAVPLEEGEYFIADLIGMQAVSDEGEDLGILEDVLQTAANDIYVICKEGETDLLVPAIKACILNIDSEKRVMTIHLLEGLRQLNEKKK